MSRGSDGFEASLPGSLTPGWPPRVATRVRAQSHALTEGGGETTAEWSASPTLYVAADRFVFTFERTRGCYERARIISIIRTVQSFGSEAIWLEKLA